MTKHSYFLYSRTYSSMRHNTNRKHNIHHTLYTNTQHIQHSKAKKTSIFNNGRCITNFPQTPTQSLQHTYNQTCAIYLHILSLGIYPKEEKTKYCAHLHHTLTVLKIYFPASLVAPLFNLEQIHSPSLNHIYTKSAPNHIHHHYVPSVSLTHTTHIISSTAPT